MSTYCTIEEAYNVPSFSKPRRATPNKMQCGQNGTPSTNNIYTNQNGNEQVAYESFVKQQTPNPNNGTPQRRNIPPKQIHTPKMVENFMCGGPAAAIPPGSTGKMSKEIDPIQGNVPYASQANDYKYEY